MKRTQPPHRRPENTTLTISLPKSLKARMEAAAADDSRKLSPWTVLQLEKIVRSLEQEASSPMIAAMADPAQTGENNQSGAK